MTGADLVLLAGVVIGSMAALGAVLAVLLAWFRGSLRNVALLMAGGGGAALLLILLTRLSPDALAMAVGLVFGVLAMLPAWGLVRAAADPNSRAHAREDWYLHTERPSGYLADWEYETTYTKTRDESGLVYEESFTLFVPKRGVTVERVNHKQLTGGTHERR
jgi:hypothetical protein